MTTGSAKVYVTKLAAARRLLRAAIRLYFDREEELAIHAIAAAAYGILKDLWTARDGNEASRATEVFLLGLVLFAQLKTKGDLPPDVLADEYMMQTLDALIYAFQLEPTTDISALDLSVSLDGMSTKHYWDENNRVSNFLKHADNKFAGRDEEVALALDNVDNFTLLMRATTSYESLAPDSLGFEGVMLEIYFLASFELAQANNEYPFNNLVEKMKAMPPDERFSFCAYQLRRPRPISIG